MWLCPRWTSHIPGCISISSSTPIASRLLALMVRPFRTNSRGLIQFSPAGLPCAIFDTSALLLLHEDFLGEALGLVNLSDPIINVFVGEKFGEVTQDLINKGFFK